MTECIPVSRWTSYPSFLYWWAFWLMLCFGCYGGSAVKHPPAVRETQVWFLGWQHPLEEGMATRSRILAWRIPCTEEPGGLYSPQGLEKVRRDWATNTFTFAVLNIVNSAALNIGEQVSSQIMIFSGSEARGGLARVSGNSAFSGLRISILLSFVTVPVWILINSSWWFPSRHILTKTWMCCLSDNSHPDSFEVIPHWGFDLDSPNG